MECDVFIFEDACCLSMYGNRVPNCSCILVLVVPLRGLQWVVDVAVLKGRQGAGAGISQGLMVACSDCDQVLMI